MSTSNFTEFRYQKDLFDAVTKAYRAARSSHPLAASNPDRDSPPNKRLTFTSIEFATDVDHANAFAFKGHTQAALQLAWFQLVTEDADVDEHTARQVITLASEVYRKRDLDPALYFRTIRRGRRREDGCQ